MSLAEPLRITLEVTAVLEQLGLRYAVGGSVASSLHGIPRSTQDIDLVVALPGKHVDALVAALEASFYVDKDMILDAIRRSASFNIIHLATLYKVDVFVADRSDLTQQELARAMPVPIGDPPRNVQVCSPEDIVLQKLDWYKRGNQVSDRQWHDLLGVLKIQGSRLDLSYLRRWAGELGVAELLDRALREAGLTDG